MQSNYLPPLEPIGDFRSYVCGDVVIDETAAIASGVLIQADQGSKIIIGAGVCIGMGAVIHAQDGLLEIGIGANLGAGVLVYGNSQIGEGCCIGASSSIVRAVIAKGAIVPPCSLISGLVQTAIAKEASPVLNQIGQAIGLSLESTMGNIIGNNAPESIPDNAPESIVERATTETYVQTNVTATPESFIANSVERSITETQVKIPVVSIPERSLESLEPLQPQSDELENGQNSQQNPQIDIEPNQQQLTTNISTIVNASVNANSAQAKAYAQAQINRYIKRLFPQN